MDQISFDMHRLVELATRRWLHDRVELEQYKYACVIKLKRVFPSGDFETWQGCEILFLNTKAMMLQKPAGAAGLLHWVDMMHDAFSYAFRRRMLHEAEEWSTQLVEVTKKVLVIEDARTLGSMLNLHHRIWRKADRRKRRFLGRKCLRWRRMYWERMIKIRW